MWGPRNSREEGERAGRRVARQGVWGCPVSAEGGHGGSPGLMEVRSEEVPFESNHLLLPESLVGTEERLEGQQCSQILGLIVVQLFGYVKNK